MIMMMMVIMIWPFDISELLFLNGWMLRLVLGQLMELHWNGFCLLSE